MHDQVTLTPLTLTVFYHRFDLPVVSIKRSTRRRVSHFQPKLKFSRDSHCIGERRRKRRQRVHPIWTTVVKRKKSSFYTTNYWITKLQNSTSSSLKIHWQQVEYKVQYCGREVDFFLNDGAVELCMYIILMNN